MLLTKLLNFIGALLLIINIVWCEENENFVATSEWQEIKEGQKIPKGLHVRINLETGKKEAKLIDSKDSHDLSVTNIEPEDYLSKIKRVTKKIKDDGADIPQRSVEGKFRMYDEIKNDLSEVNLFPKTDFEIMTELMEKYKKTSDKNLLIDMEYLSHQIDIAYEFARKDGFRLIYKNFNGSDSEIKILSLRLMASLMQNNPKVQIYGLESGSIRFLLSLLNTEKDVDVQYNTIAALSSLLRRFPLAQKTLISEGGISIFTSLLKSDNIKLCVKIITLMNDLVIEHQLAVSEKDKKDVVSQYEQVNMEKKLYQHSWCEYFNSLLKMSVVSDDYVEKILNSMSTFNDCLNTYDLEVLKVLSKKYNDLAVLEVDDDAETSRSSYFSELKELSDVIIQKLKSNKIEL